MPALLRAAALCAAALTASSAAWAQYGFGSPAPMDDRVQYEFPDPFPAPASAPAQSPTTMDDRVPYEFPDPAPPALAPAPIPSTSSEPSIPLANYDETLVSDPPYHVSELILDRVTELELEIAEAKASFDGTIMQMNQIASLEAHLSEVRALLNESGVQHELLSVTQNAMLNFFRTIGLENVPHERQPEVLAELANKFVDQRQELEATAAQLTDLQFQLSLLEVNEIRINTLKEQAEQIMSEAQSMREDAMKLIAIRNAMLNFFRALGLENVPQERQPEVLAELANKFVEQRQELEATAAQLIDLQGQLNLLEMKEVRINTLKEQARAASAAGDHARAAQMMGEVRSMREDVMRTLTEALQSQRILFSADLLEQAQFAIQQDDLPRAQALQREAMALAGAENSTFSAGAGAGHSFTFAPGATATFDSRAINVNNGGVAVESLQSGSGGTNMGGVNDNRRLAPAQAE